MGTSYEDIYMFMIVSHNVENYSRDGEAIDDERIWHIYCVWWITKVTNTLSEFLLLFAFPWQR
jgi:hypothetical protein